MDISLFEMFKIGIGPSSSHTVAPMKAAFDFVTKLKQQGQLQATQTIQVNLHGSLALTGKGHHTDQAVILGLAGFLPATVPIDDIPKLLAEAKQLQRITTLDGHCLQLTDQSIRFISQCLPKHENGLEFIALDDSEVIASDIYYSIGGGFFVTDADFGKTNATSTPVRYPFDSAASLVALCQQHQLSISALIRANEQTWHDDAAINTKTQAIWQVMQTAIEKGCHSAEVLPGPLQLPRRAPDLYQALQQQADQHDPAAVMDWVNLFALAVSEENAAGGRIVTSPTNGAAGIIPAVLRYYDLFIQPIEQPLLWRYLATAGAIGMLYKRNASISGAEVGCQGEIGVSCSMAAAGLTALKGGSPVQITVAAEIAMEHHLGMTCDPVGGQVQIPCIERNAMSAVKAINAASMALRRSDQGRVSLDSVILTMYETGKDLNSKYRETATGGLAIKVPPVCR